MMLIDGMTPNQKQAHDLRTQSAESGISFSFADAFSAPMNLLRNTGVSGLLAIARDWRQARLEVKPGENFKGMVSPYRELLKKVGARYGFEAAVTEWDAKFASGSTTPDPGEAGTFAKGLSARLVSGIEDRDYSPRDLRSIQLLINTICTEMFRQDAYLYQKID